MAKLLKDILWITKDEAKHTDPAFILGGIDYLNKSWKEAWIALKVNGLIRNNEFVIPKESKILSIKDQEFDFLIPNGKTLNIDIVFLDDDNYVEY